MTCIDCIGKYTNPDEYELIVVNPEPSEAIRDDYHILKIDKHINPSPDPDYASCMNIGAKQAEGKYLVFLQNDVFVQERWLPGLRQYIESGDWDLVFPDQMPRSRQYILDSYTRGPFEKESLDGARDAGLVMMTREAFDKVGGWGEGLSILAERDFYERMGRVGIRWTGTIKVYITHIMGATNWFQCHEDYQAYNARAKKDADRLNK